MQWWAAALNVIVSPCNCQILYCTVAASSKFYHRRDHTPFSGGRKEREGKCSDGLVCESREAPAAAAAPLPLPLRPR